MPGTTLPAGAATRNGNTGPSGVPRTLGLLHWMLKSSYGVRVELRIPRSYKSDHCERSRGKVCKILGTMIAPKEARKGGQRENQHFAKRLATA